MDYQVVTTGGSYAADIAASALTVPLRSAAEAACVALAAGPSDRVEVDAAAGATWVVVRVAAVQKVE